MEYLANSGSITSEEFYNIIKGKVQKHREWMLWNFLGIKQI